LGREKTGTLAAILSIIALLALLSVRNTSQSWHLYTFSICFGFGGGLLTPTMFAGAADIQVAVRKKRDDLLAALNAPDFSDHILYFYCHAVTKQLGEDGGPGDSCIIMTGKERLSLDDFQFMAPATQLFPNAPLVFMNACQSAELSPAFYDGFVPYFMAKGARGVIGTECDIPAFFAKDWAGRLFQKLLAGDSVGQAVLALRRDYFFEKNNLLGLLYALHVDVDTCMAPML